MCISAALFILKDYMGIASISTDSSAVVLRRVLLSAMGVALAFHDGFKHHASPFAM